MKREMKEKKTKVKWFLFTKNLLKPILTYQIILTIGKQINFNLF